MEFPSIALLTDFGERDGFVGVMKGVIYNRLESPVPIIDISHGIDPQNIRQASWILGSARAYFPPKAVFVCVVDPGVGTSGQASLLCWWPQKRQAFIAPDNGLLTPVLQAAESELQVCDIRTSAFYQETATQRSRTFHGRDVYAPVAALMANALLNDTVESFLADFGLLSGPPTRLPWPKPGQSTENSRPVIKGHILYSDTFGNLITNIPNDWIASGQVWTTRLGEKTDLTVICRQAYAEEPQPGQVLLIPSSGGTVELSLYGDTARAFLHASIGETIRLHLKE